MHPTDVVYGGYGVISFQAPREVGPELGATCEDIVAAVIAEEA